MHPKSLLLGAAAAALIAIPAIAQQLAQPQSQPQTPATSPAQPATTPADTPAAQPSSSSGPSDGSDSSDESSVQEVNPLSLQPQAPVQPPVEYPGWARRDPWEVGKLNPTDIGVGADPWGSTNGPFLSTLMRRMDTPIASRWAHIALRNALLAKARAPSAVNPVDWVAERAWLLLRMGEADAARMLVDAVDVDRFTPKMVQVAVQTALANADPAALCPLQPDLKQSDPTIRPLVQAMCASLAGDPDSASAQIDNARRYGRTGGIDLALAEKVVGAAGGSRSATIEWDPVNSLTAWRFGLSVGTGMAPPDRLINDAPARLRAFEARAPLLSPQQRANSALVAAGLGVFSSQSLVDLYSAIYDTTDPSDVPTTDAWQLRKAFVAKDNAARLDAIRHLLALGKDGFAKEGARAMVARAATLVKPDAKLGKDAPDLISAMLAGGFDRAAAAWIPAIDGMDDEQADRAWAMLVLAAPDAARAGTGRLSGFIRRDNSPGKVRSALLVAGLAGLGRISADNANSLNRSYGLGLGGSTSWTKAVDGTRAGGSALVLTGTGLQTASWQRVPSLHLYHALMALERTGQDFTARMIAAEALSRT